MRPHVKVGNRYRMEEGEIEVESMLPINLADITPALARASGFRSVADLLGVAKHGRGESVYLIHFHYVPPETGSRGTRSPARAPAPRRRVGARGEARRRRG